jgi:hypothetical protein
VLLVEFQILILIACFFNFAALLFLGHLTLFHIKLQRRGMTTYEFIRWKENNTRASKIVKRKANKGEEENSGAIQTALNHQEFMDSSKRLASLFGDNKSLESKNGDSDDAFFSKEGKESSPLNTVTASILIPGTK